MQASDREFDPFRRYARNLSLPGAAQGANDTSRADGTKE
jgi:hypothetical protein